VVGLLVPADDDLHALDDGALLDRIAELIGERNRIDAELTRTIRVADARQACEHDGSRTNLENSALLCERHHTKVHHGFRVERQPDGRWRTRRPDGTEIRTGPRRTGPGRTGPPVATAA
jgi:hypothetical protein